MKQLGKIYKSTNNAFMKSILKS